MGDNTANSTGVMFPFKELEVWKKAIIFAKQIIVSVDKIEDSRKHYRLFEQIESSSASVAQNIAEGKGRHSKKEFVHYLYTARGSLYETITLLNLFHSYGWISETELDNFEHDAVQITKMLSGLINSIQKS